jgi:hypothetical protein
LEGAEGGPVPMALAAVTVKVYVVLLSRPLTVTWVVSPLTVVLMPPGLEVMGLPPSFGASQFWMLRLVIAAIRTIPSPL